MVYKKMRVKLSVLEYQKTVQELDILFKKKNTTMKYSRTMLFIVIMVGILFLTLFAWTIKLQFTEVNELLSHDEETEIVTYNVSMPENNGQVVSCYYNMPSINIKTEKELMPSDIHPHLCTHINVAFAKIKDKQIHLETYQQQIILDVVELKKSNPALKVLLSVGGAGSHSGFSDMVTNHTSRKIFIRSLKFALRNLSLDGIDLDWEFPAIGYQNKFGKRERQHFSQLLREIRMEYKRESRDHLLTVAAAAPQIIVEAAYDIDQINMYVDFVNIMSYDYHSYTQFTPLTGLNSPLYARPTEELYFATLNINYTVGMYISKGLDPNKIVVGIPTYGHSFTLVNDENTKVGSPALGFGELGHLGFVNYPDICAFLNEFKNQTIIKEESNAKVPYFYSNSEWVSYDNPESVVEKAKYIRNNNLRGAMIYSLNADDYDGLCDKIEGITKFPLALSIKNTLKNGIYYD